MLPTRRRLGNGKMIKGLCALALIVWLAGCPSAYVNGLPNEGSPYFQLPVGSELLLEQPVQVPAGRNQLYFQNGRTMDWQHVNIYLPHCALKVAAKQESPRSIQPDRFVVGKSGTERFFQPIHAPDMPPGLQTPAVALLTVGVDFEPDGNMDYEVVAVVMELRSERQPDVTALICTDWGLPQDTLHVTVQKIRRALGAYFTIKVWSSPGNTASLRSE